MSRGAARIMAAREDMLVRPLLAAATAVALTLFRTDLADCCSRFNSIMTVVWTSSGQTCGSARHQPWLQMLLLLFSTM
jgi:hypothetical protein